MNDKLLANPFPVIGMLIRLSALIFLTSLVLVGLHLLCDAGSLVSIALIASLLWVSMLMGLLIIQAFAKLGPWKLVMASIVAAAPRLVVCLVGLVISIKVYHVSEVWALTDLAGLYLSLLAVETYLIWRYINQTQWDNASGSGSKTHPQHAHKEVCTS
jgi:hypothetical protein